MSASMKWAVLVALLLIAFAIGGGAVWQRQHPETSVVATLTKVLPALPGSAPSDKKPTPDTAVQPKPVGTPPARHAEGGAAPLSAPTPAAAPVAAPRFDIVRVEPKGDTVVAGSGAPHAKVALIVSGKVVAETTADGSGQFVLLPPPLPPGDHDLTLRQTRDAAADGHTPTASALSAQSVAVSVPTGAKGRVVVALAEPGRPTKLLSAPPEPPPATTNRADAQKAVPQSLGIRSVELENGNGFYATGAAKPGTPVHIYLNDAHLADVVAGADGAWSVTIRKGLAGGRYTVRADAGPGTTVTARAEVPFDVPVAMADRAKAVTPANSRTASLATPRSDAEAPQASASAGLARGTPTADPAPTAAPAAAPDAARVVIEEVRTKEVLNGDNLWRISRERLGFGKRFTQIYAANAAQIRDPKLIYPGQVFVLPAQ